MGSDFANLESIKEAAEAVRLRATHISDMVDRALRGEEGYSETTIQPWSAMMAQQAARYAARLCALAGPVPQHMDGDI